ncbi:MAG: aminotransferase class I/II-fold pyridoxal phosphate-dependent enzyme [Candidatus Melainabacteria bacterium]
MPHPPTKDALLTDCRDSLNRLRADGQFRQCLPLTNGNEAIALLEGQPVVNFSSNNYLGLATDPRLKEAALQAIEQHGVGSSGSRLMVGSMPQTRDLEAAIAGWQGTESALFCNTGYQGNVAVLQALLNKTDWVFADRLNHASLMDGVRLAGAKLQRYRHLDLQDLADRLEKAPATVRKWVITESLFSMDGDIPDLPALVNLAESCNATVVVDEAHAVGYFGAHGAGLCAHTGVSDRVLVKLGTFSKALGGAGGYVAAPRVITETVINHARGFIFSTAMPPALPAAALAALAVIQTDPHPAEQLWENIRQARALLSDAPQGAGIQSPIIPIPIGDSGAALRISGELQQAGFLVRAIRPPTVPTGTARLRLSLMATHTPAQIRDVIRAIAYCQQRC